MTIDISKIRPGDEVDVRVRGKVLSTYPTNIYYAHDHSTHYTNGEDILAHRPQPKKKLEKKS